LFGSRWLKEEEEAKAVDVDVDVVVVVVHQWIHHLRHRR
jgi:hypothetical protein